MDFRGFVEVEDDIWFSSNIFNGLVCIEKNKGKIKEIVNIPGYSISECLLFSGLLNVGGVLVAIPSRSKAVLLYNLKEKSMLELEIDKKYFVNDLIASFIGIVYDKYVYIFPTGMRCVIKVDVYNKEITYIDNGINRIYKLIGNNDIVFRQQYEIIESKVYLALANIGGYVVFDFEEERFDIHLIDGMEGCVTINNYDDKFYMGCWRKKIIYEVNKEDDSFCRFLDFPDDYEYDVYSFANSCIKDDSLIFLPLMANEMISFNITSKQITKEVLLDNLNDKNIFTFFCQEGKCYFDVRNSIDCLEYDNNSWYIKNWVVFNQKYNKKYIAKYLKENGYYSCIVENKKNDLDDFLNMLLT